MIHQRQFDDLMKTAWEVIESDFDRAAFVRWRSRAFDYLTTILDEDDPYIQRFRECVQEPRTTHVLAGKGVLFAAKENAARQESVIHE